MTTTVFTSRAERFRLKRTEQKERTSRPNVVGSKNLHHLDILQKSGGAVAINSTVHAPAPTSTKPAKAAILSIKNRPDGSRCKKFMILLAEREVPHSSCDSGDFLLEKPQKKGRVFFAAIMRGKNRRAVLAIAA